MIDINGNKDDHLSHMEFLTTIVTTLESKRLLRKLYMGEDENLLLDGLNLVKQSS